MERSPQILARAIGMLPPAQDPGIVLGEERYGGEQVHMDLLAYGRVVGPHDEHLAAQAAGTVGRWEEAWKSGDLLIHDFSFVAAIRSMDPDFLFAEEVATEAIWRLLNGEPVLDGDGQPVVRPPVHQGPVGCLRMVLAPPPAQEVGVVWMRRIRELRGEDGLRELVVFNTNRPVTEAFPLRALPAGLRTLALGFFTLHLHKPIERLARLTQLSLTGCAFSGQALSSLLPYLYSLRILALGSCNITAHCGPEGLTIVSSSLVRLNMWSCTASGGVSLQYTPRMAHFSVGVRPEHAGNARLHIQIRTAGALRELDGLMMHRHDLSYLVPYKQEKVRCASHFSSNAIPFFSLIRKESANTTTTECLCRYKEDGYCRCNYLANSVSTFRCLAPLNWSSYLNFFTEFPD